MSRQEKAALVRAVVVGAGRIAEQHLPALAGSGSARVVGVCDPSRLLAEHACARFGGTAHGRLEEALAAERPDLVCVLTPAALHVPMVLSALEAGAAVLVEKPMALDEQGRETLLRRAQERSRLLVEDHNYLFNRPMQALLRALRSGELGDLAHVDVDVIMPLGPGNRYADRNLPSPSHDLPTGFVHEFLTHMAYLAAAVEPGLQVEEVRWAKRVPGHASRHDEMDARLAAAGVTGRLRFSAMGPRPAIAVHAIGTEGRASAELIFGSYQVSRPRRVGQQLSPSADAVLDGLRSVGRGAGYVVDRLRGRTAYEGLHELVRRTVDAVATGGPPPVTPREMRAAGALVDAVARTAA